jgi:CO/xanthine dehydrogenase Mo-binding subunit
MALSNSIVQHPRIDQWIKVFDDNTVQLQTGKVELGQGILTALSQLALEELDIDPLQLRLVSGDTAQGPNEWYTAGSLSIEVGGMAIRQVCAHVRHLMLAEAARISGLPIEQLVTRSAHVLSKHPNHSLKLSYAQLAINIDWQKTVSDEIPLKPVQDHLYIGQSMRRIDLPERLAGRGFIHDLKFPNLWHARVLRPNSQQATLMGDINATVQSLSQLDGVDHVYACGNFLALLSNSEAALIRALEKAKNQVQWHAKESIAMPQGPSHFLRNADSQTQRVSSIEEKPQPQLGSGDGFITVEADYSKPFIAHASIGTSCGLAHWQDNQLTVYSHSQGVFQLRSQIARALRINESQVQVIHQPGSGCYGHNGADDAAFDAALLAFHHPGRFIRVLWSREDELGWSPVGSAMSVHLKASLDQHHQINDWSLNVWSGRHGMRPGLGDGVNLLSAWRMEDPHPIQPPADLPVAMGGGGQRNSVALYDFPQQVDYHFIPNMPLRTSSLRTLGAFGNVFAIESFMDELAQTACIDPLQFRLNHLSDPRAREVLLRVAEISQWAEPAGRHLGIAWSRYKNKAAYLAVVAEVEVIDDIHVKRLWAVVDAGLIINPDGLRNQIEGGLVQALSWTMKEEVRFDSYGITSTDWEQYPILKFSEMPDSIQIELINRTDQLPLGAGEAAAGPLAGAVANAVSKALGQRVRDLPFSRERLLQQLS